MADHSDAGPKRSPYADDICAVYFSGQGPLYIPCSLLSEEMKEFADFEGGNSAHPLAKMWLDDIAIDVGHVIIHYLVTGTYQYLQHMKEWEKEEKDFSAEFAAAIRVYVAANNLPLPALREMAKGEILRVGDWLSLPVLIKVMEEAALPFKEYPGIAAYVESRLLSFSESAAMEDGEHHVDKTLLALGAPDTLSQVVLRSVLLSKASRGLQMESPTYKYSWDNPEIELRPTRQAMEWAENLSFRNAVAARHEEENLHPQKPKAKQNGGNSRRDWKRVGAFEDKAEQGVEEVASGRKRNAPRWDADDWPALPSVSEEVVDAHEHAPVFSQRWGEVPKAQAFKRHDQCDSPTVMPGVWIDQLTPGSSQNSPEYGAAVNW
ncbi:hypothetical protein FPANT_6205 [Fusarium pseudoanthophilum]|uniref:Uncharacterized protein n=1 Tax=Fusarium pseudoanthophilum TaxID=48495 RepID=A0A8H5LDD7_9HYPO|nr:hypothetical protein FPANT_6205 [Fusarium pseudoanthophilum]